MNSPVRLFLSFHTCFLLAAVAQPLDARNELIFPVNPPRKASPIQAPRDFSLPSSWVPRTQSGPPDKNPQIKISGAEFIGDGSGARELSVSMAHLGSTEFEPSDVRVIVYFFESDDDGKIQLAGSRIAPAWATLPVDWKDGSEEKLVLRYPAPAADSGRKYAGWVVRVSLEDRLQDARCSSPEFLSRLPLSSALQGLTSGQARTRLTNADESDRFLAAYKGFQAAEHAFLHGDLVKAKESVDKVISDLVALQKESPGWQSKVVDYRLKSARTLLAKIEEE